MEKIAICSAKGGVGKTTIAYSLAMKYHKAGKKIGLLDADIYGPNLINLFAYANPNQSAHNSKIKPAKLPYLIDGIEFSSTDLLFDPDDAAMLRGPMLSKILKELYEKSFSADLDYLFIDMPPGTGDAYLTVCQKIVPNFVILVSTVSKLSIADLRRSEHVFESLNTKVLGIILNNIHQSDDFQSFNLETENTVLDRLEYDKKFVDSTYPFDDLKLDPLFLNTIRTIKEHE